jgi:hypothetical protein
MEAYLINCNIDLLLKSREVLQEQVGTKEATGANDGEVEKYLKSIGLSKGQPYCAAGQYWVFLEACKRLDISAKNVPIKKTGLALNIYNDVKDRGTKVMYVPGVDALLVWVKANGINGHVERITKVLNQSGDVETVGFNTSNGKKGSQREGDGVFIRQRNIFEPLGTMVVKGMVIFNAI